MPFIKLNKTEYHYKQSGKGNPAIFAHGLFVDNTIFKYQIEELNKIFTCYSFDMPGHGKSSFPEDGWTFDDVVDDFQLFIVKKKLFPVVLIGQSQGGMIFMRLAIKYPKLVSKLILIGTSAKEEHRDKIPFWQEMVTSFRNRCNSNYKSRMELVQKNVVSAHFINNYSDEKNRELMIMQSQNSHAMALATEAAILNRTNILTSLKKIISPTIIFCGQDDLATPVEASIEMKNNIKNSKLIIIPNAAHHIPIENPKELNKHIIEFLK